MRRKMGCKGRSRGRLAIRSSVPRVGTSPPRPFYFLSPLPLSRGIGFCYLLRRLRVDEETDSFVTCLELRDWLFSLAMCVFAFLFPSSVDGCLSDPSSSSPYFSARSENRAVLSRGGKAVDLTEDHKPNAPGELERIYRYTLYGCTLLSYSKSVACFTL